MTVREAGASMKATMGIHRGQSLKEVIEAKKRIEGPREFPLAGLLDLGRCGKGTWGWFEVLFGMCSIQQDEDGVTATLENRETSVVSSLRAEYLIAANGAGSPIRNQPNVPIFGQGTMGYLLNVLFHVDLKPLVHRREFSICMIERPDVGGAFTSINNDR